MAMSRGRRAARPPAPACFKPVSAACRGKGCIAWMRAADVQGTTFVPWGGTQLDTSSRTDRVGLTMDIESIQLETHGDSRGMLVALEAERNVPFPIRRVYYLFATVDKVHRGCHAHRHLNQLAVAVRGSVSIMLDDGNGPVEVRLDDPSRGLLMGCMVWRELYDFSDDCVLMVLADQPYDPADYIVDYDLFLREVRGEQEGQVAWAGR